METEKEELKLLEDILKEVRDDTDNKGNGAAAMDINVLVAEFGEICPDILIDSEQMDYDQKSMASHFAYNILMKIGPESSKLVKKGQRNNTWQLKFPSKSVEEDDNKTHEKVQVDKDPLIFKTVHIHSNKNSFKELNSTTEMNMTLERASLVAMVQFQKLIKYAYLKPKPVHLMTYFCKAIFSEHEIKDMAEELQMEPWTVLMTINASSIWGGHVLPTSNINCAMACTAFTTRSLDDKERRRSILIKTARQYYHAKGSYSISELCIWMKYTNGGLPRELQLENLYKLFNEVRMLRQANFFS